MKKPKPKPIPRPKPPSQRDKGYTNILHHLTKNLKAVTKRLEHVVSKLDALVEAGGGGEKGLKQLSKAANRMDAETDKLQSAVAANQPTTKERENK